MNFEPARDGWSKAWRFLGTGRPFGGEGGPTDGQVVGPWDSSK
jgi:hypothetical protein